MGTQEATSVNSLEMRPCNRHLVGGATGSSLPLSGSCKNVQCDCVCAKIDNGTDPSTSSPSAFPSYSPASTKKTTHLVSLKKSFLTSRGFKSFKDWNSNPNNVYIGRDMSHCVPGACGSKWGNPFKAKKANKKSISKCLERYEDHIRRRPDLFNG